MRQHLACAIHCWALAGCSLLYSPNNLPGVPAEAGIDSPDDVEVILDADPRMLVLDDVAPATIYEGQGDLGSAPALVVIHGHHIIDSNTVVEITPTSGAPQLAFGAPVVAKNGNWIAIPVTAHVDLGLAKTDRIKLDVKVTETIPSELGGGTATFTLHDKLALQGLSELIPLAGTTIDTATLEPMYSKVDLSKLATASFTGAARAIIRSVSSITALAITANGGSGGTPAAMMTLVGGCAGGGPASTGGCNGTIGGKGGTDGGVLGGAGGGGGGGFASDGEAGSGNGHGDPGLRTGDELIATYDGFDNHAANRAGGGGGGGKPTVSLGNGGAGGASGGSIELTAGGDVTVGAITANGGDGEKAAGTTGGGGGAGGLVMLRADNRLTLGGPISVNAGLGGPGGVGNGGDGAPGRIRWDAQGGSSPAITKGTQHRGPTFTVTTRLFRTPVVKISLNGAAGDRFAVYALNGGVTYLGTGTDQGSQVTIGPDGTVVYSQTLQQGLSHLCVTLEGGKPGTPEGDKCVDVAFLP